MIMISPAVTMGARELRSGAMIARGLGSREADGPAVDLQEGFLLLAVGGGPSAQAGDLAHNPGVEAAALGLGIDLADVGGETRLLFLEPLDALDERTQAIRRDAAGLLHGRSPKKKRGQYRRLSGLATPAPTAQCL